MDQKEYQLEMKKLFEEVELRFDSSFEKINDQINSIICDLENNLDQKLKSNYKVSIAHQQEIILPLSYLPDVQNEQLSLELISLTKLYKEYQVNQVKISFNQQLEKQASLQQQYIDKLEKEKRQLEISRKYETKNESQIVLIGLIGSGKTTLFNLICQTKQPTSQSHSTQQPFLKKAAYGSGFRVLDTPGYGSFTEQIAHAVSILNALTEGPINKILIVANYKRIELMESDLRKIIILFRRYKHLLGIAVTFLDTADLQTITIWEEQVKRLAASYNINSVMFISKSDSGEKICAQIDSFLDLSQAQEVQLTESELYYNFDVVESHENIVFELYEQMEEVMRKFGQISNVIIQFIHLFDNQHPLMHEIMYHLAQETKIIAMDLIEDFQFKNNEKFSGLFEYHKNPSHAYLVHFQLKKALMQKIEQIVNLTVQKVEPYYRGHLFKFIKACPYCGLIWLKVSGSCGSTYCGEFPEVDDNFFEEQKSIQRIKFNISKNGVDYTLNQDVQKPAKTYAQPQRLMGCRKQFVWDEIPPLSNKLLQELIDPGIMDYLTLEVQQYELRKTLKNSEESLRNQIYQIKQKSKVIKL